MPRIAVITTVATLTAILTMPCFASTVREKEIEYQYGSVVKAVPADAFTVCDGCRVDALHKQPLPFVTIRKASAQQFIERPGDQGMEQEVSRFVFEEEETQKSLARTDVGRGLLGTVLFRFDSDHLSEQEKVKLDHLAAALPPGTGITITGYACSVGTASHNMKLSDRRAKAVAKYLRAKNVRLALVEAKGECCPASTINKLNRRVEIESKEDSK